MHYLVKRVATVEVYNGELQGLPRGGTFAVLEDLGLQRERIGGGVKVVTGHG